MPIEIDHTATFTAPPEQGAVDPTDIAARRAAMFAAAEAGSAPEMALPKEPHKPREEVESVVVELPNGLTVEFGPPKGVSLTMRMAVMFGEDNPNRMATTLIRTLLCIRSIDGRAPPFINNMVDAQQLANVIGDDGADVLFSVLRETWPPTTRNDFKVLKKNQRVT